MCTPFIVVMTITKKNNQKGKKHGRIHFLAVKVMVHTYLGYMHNTLSVGGSVTTIKSQVHACSKLAHLYNTGKMTI